MIRLQTQLGLSLAEAIRNVSPIQYEPVHIKEKTLDGTIHIQTIGEPSKYITFETLSNQTQVDLINSNWAKGGKFKFVDEENYYIGIIEDSPQWERLTPRYSNKLRRKFTSSMKLVITEEGAL